MTLARAVRNALTLLLVALPVLLLLPRLKAPVALPPEAMEQLVVARYTAATNRLGNPVVRPLEANRVVSYGDGALPDLRHSLLYTGLSALSLKALHETRGGMGQRASLGFGLLLLFLGGLSTLWLCRICLPRYPALQAALLFVWSGGAVLGAVQPGPGLLLAVLGSLLFAALIRMDVRHLSQRASVGVALAVGVLWGLLFLSAYSALLLFPLLLAYVVRGTRRDFRAVLAFLVGASVSASPQLVRAYKLTHNPLYHSRVVELAMRTESYPGTGLYQSLSLPKPLGTYLTTGGFGEVAARTAATLTELLPRTVGAAGLAVLLFAASGLIRFSDSRLNTLRNFVFLALPLHLLGLSLFFPAEECVRVVLLYVPAIAVLATGFLQTVVHARRLPRFHARTQLTLWTLACCGSGLAQALALRPAPPLARLYAFPGASQQNLERLQTEQDGILAAQDPATVAFVADVPVTALPTSATDFLELEKRLNKEIAGFALTPTLRQPQSLDPADALWAETYRQVIGLFAASETLPKAEREQLRARIRYPEPLLPAISRFQVTPVREPEIGNDFSALFWDLDYVSRS